MSRSSNGNPFRNGHHGSDHYQRRGFFGGLANFFGSGSSGGYNNYPGGYTQTPEMNPQRPSMTCRKCNAQIQYGSKFCSECGEKVAETSFCPSCGEKLSPNAKFCSSCGARMM